ncbi:MAG TPA: hypothetical protein PK208_09635 [Fibrobacteria bacterium]|nr:hypothetical protein [Fibrobacteria bacterium]
MDLASYPWEKFEFPTIPPWPAFAFEIEHSTFACLGNSLKDNDLAKKRWFALPTTLAFPTPLSLLFHFP